MSHEQEVGTSHTVRYREGQHRSGFVCSSRFGFQSISQQGPKASWTKELLDWRCLHCYSREAVLHSVLEMGQVGRRIQGNQIKMTLSEKNINIFPSVVTLNFVF